LKHRPIQSEQNSFSHTTKIPKFAWLKTQPDDIELLTHVLSCNNTRRSILFPRPNIRRSGQDERAVVAGDFEAQGLYA
ncbi:MAG TPA: hypothetical protein VGV87_20195, partial [Blastocatellia bacterium]|nr:hypothetical protein [Blastocatellia bacterium]